ncbi:helix-turn-helix domain-containing protein [Cloacibacillus evryensis]|uniref:helix-turn-helix domain-containing protein n=1 Tax=Cloacibacillus evryensis TaxID=508460 RepID=UPI002671DC9C|nr:helix-turn-helix transcriptional regulator [Cloacibacillus evryensis]
MEKIRELRLLKKMTQEQLAEAADLSAGYISALENGKKSPSLKRLEKIAGILGVTSASLFDEEREPPEQCPFMKDGRWRAPAPELDDVSKEICALLRGVPLETKIKILDYEKDMKRLSDLTSKRG